MATLAELSERLLKRFKGVPNYTIEDAEQALEDAMLTLGYGVGDSVPNDKVTALLLLAQSESAFNIAFSVAHYFKYSDGEEAVDKSTVAANYRALANDLRKRYDDEQANGGAGGSKSSFAIATRPDRRDRSCPYGYAYTLARSVLNR